LWTGALSFLADACVATKHRAAAELVHRGLAPFTGMRVAVAGLALYGAADRYLGQLAEVRGRPDQAERYLEAALRLDERTGSPTWTAHSSYALGGFLARRGRRDDRSRAQALVGRADDTARALGMATLARRCTALLDEMGPRTSEDEAVSPLTAREASVLRLVARGRTNRQIGEQLHVSEHTVANHIRAILIKTGCANRAEAAAWAQRAGLLPL
jgi:DNA-binding CsgD family transcriptional regulator